MNKTSRNILIGVLIIIVVAIIVYFAVEANKAAAPTTTQQQSSVSSTTNTSSSTATTSLSGETVMGAPTTTTSSMKTFSNGSFSLNYPSAWTIYENRPFSLDNFGAQYSNNSVIPAGGAEFDIVTTTAYSGYGAIMQSELLNASALTTSTVTVDGTSCTQAMYKDNQSASEPLDDIAIYCSKGTELWKIYFDYNNSDPAAAAHLAVFEDMLGSLKLNASE